MKYGFHPEARGELVESAAYYDSQQRGLGERFLSSVTDIEIVAVMHLHRMPGYWKDRADI